MLMGRCVGKCHQRPLYAVQWSTVLFFEIIGDILPFLSKKQKKFYVEDLKDKLCVWGITKDLGNTRTFREVRCSWPSMPPCNLRVRADVPATLIIALCSCVGEVIITHSSQYGWACDCIWGSAQAYPRRQEYTRDFFCGVVGGSENESPKLHCTPLGRPAERGAGCWTFGETFITHLPHLHCSSKFLAKISPNN